MNAIKTYQDLEKVLESPQQTMDFCYNAIGDYQSSDIYKNAVDGSAYANGHNTLIEQYQKVLYTIAGDAVPDNYTANHKCKSGFFKRFVIQEAAYLLKNGISFDGKGVEEKLGENFDVDLYEAAKVALAQGVCYGFFNLKKIEYFPAKEFIPLYDEENGHLRAGIRYWQLDSTKPLRITLFEEDGYTNFIRKDAKMEILDEKHKYKQKVEKTEADGEQVVGESNYEDFPVVPLFANSEEQSELVGIKEQVDCYDLIKSGFANDLDDASMIYWTLTNCGGMQDIDLAKFIERMKVLKAAVVNSDGDEGRAEAHTVDVPYESREVYLTRLRKDLYEDAMALDITEVAAGSVTATQIEAAYEPLDEKSTELKNGVTKFLKAILKLAGFKDKNLKFSFTPSTVKNKREETETILMSANLLDTETMLRKLPFLTDDEIDQVMQRKAAEDAERFKLAQQMQPMV